MYYSVSTLFYSRHSPGPPIGKDTLWEEIIYLVAAETREEAVQRAEIIAKRDEISYDTETDRVNWRFSRVIDVSHLEYEKIEEGHEIFSRFLTAEQADTLARNGFAGETGD